MPLKLEKMHNSCSIFVITITHKGKILIPHSRNIKWKREQP